MFLSGCLAAILHGYAQPSLTQLKESIRKQRSENLYQLKLSSATQGALQFSPASRLAKKDLKTWLSSQLGLRTGKDELLKTPTVVRYASNIELEKYHQYYKGIKVEHGFVNLLSVAGKPTAAQLEFYSLNESITAVPKLTETEALAKATAFVGASKYVWEGYTGNNPDYKKPTGELVFVEDYFGKKGNLSLAYKFEVFAEKPLSRSYVYVSAANGSVLLVDRIIKHFAPDGDGEIKTQSVAANKTGVKKRIDEKTANNISGTAQTRYSNSQSIVTDNNGVASGKPFRLRQVRNGHDIVTLNYERRINSPGNDVLATDFTDDDNDWTTAENSANYDDAALDVQYAMQFISDYWKAIHGRNSWDNAGSEMRSFVHVRSANTPSSGYDNAFWSGSAMYYGDGTYYAADGSGNVNDATGFKPLTSLDVSAHELGHAVCQSTAQLVYQRESGAMNEGFSDIWAACVENYSGLPKYPFLIGEEIFPAGGALRNMQNPKQFSNPDTYGGQYWTRVTLAGCAIPGSSNDECGVHNNSGVLNKWFYLLTEGGSGTNDKSNSYNVSGLGFAKSEKIAFLLEQTLTPNADYAAARLAAINAAAALYGPCSNEVIQVTNAWFAVGVGESSNCSPAVEFMSTALSATEGDGIAGTCSSTKTVSVPVKLGTAATQQTDVQFQFSGTAVQGVNYTVASPSVSFNAGESGAKNLDLTILDNQTAQGNETIVLSYTINAHGGDATAGINNQTCTVTLTDDDALPLPVQAAPITTDTLLYENFEASPAGTAFPVGWDGAQAFSGGGSTINKWVIGTGASLNGNAAYVSKTPGATNVYAYADNSYTDRLLRMRKINTTGYGNLNLSFVYKTGGEVDSLDPGNLDPNYMAALWDYGRVVYNQTGTGTSYTTLFNTPANDYFAFYGNGVALKNFGPSQLPSSLENKAAVYLGFRWKNDDSLGNGLPFAVDDILVTGRTKGTSIETAANGSNSVRALPGSSNTYIASNGGTALLAKLSNLSQTISCLTATVTEAGSGRTVVHTGNGDFFRTQKIIQLTPGSPNSTATYKATLYFTASDLSAWSSAEIPQLKILKVKDGVDLNGTLDPTNSVVVTPSFTDNSVDGYYTYTGSFTGFSQFMLVSPTFTLPVNLLSFDAVPQKSSVALSWATASETGNKGFAVERSVSGNDYKVVGWVAGAGTTSGASHYQFVDEKVQPGIVYQYRLKQVDNNNNFRYSAVRQVRLADEAITIAIGPNPAKNNLRIIVTGAVHSADISLLNAKGQQVAKWKGANLSAGYEAAVGNFARGIYTVVVHLPEGDKTAQVVLQ